MKKILVITTTFPRWVNDSTPAFVFDLSKRLTKKYNLVVLAPHHYKAKKSEVMNGLRIYRFPYFLPEKHQKLCYNGGILPNIKKSFLAKIQVPFFLLSEYFFIKKIMGKEKIDLIHAHWIFPNGFLAALLKKRYGVPLIVTVHGSDIFALRNIFFRFLQGITLKNCDMCTVNSSATETEVLKRLPKFKNKIVKIPMGVDLDKFREKKIVLKKYKEEDIILFVGRLSKQKGVEYLINAMPELLKKIKKARLLIIGEGQTRKELEKLTKRQKLERHVEFLGSLPQNKVIEFYNAAKVVVLPALSDKTGTEGLGLVLLEAMATKTAVVGSNIGGIKDIIRDKETGLLSEQKNPRSLSKCIITLLKDKNLQNKVALNGQKFVKKNYSWDLISNKFSDIYKKTMKA